MFALSKQTFTGMSVIRAFGKESEFNQNFIDLLHKDILFYDLSLGVQAYNMWSTQFVKLVVIFCTFGACVYLKGSVATVTLSMIMLRVCSLDEKTTRSLRYTNQIKNRMYSIQKLLEFETIAQEKEEHVVTVDKEWPDKGLIEFNQISLRYRPNTDLVINNLTLRIEPGMKVGVVGRTGAGKSTLGLTLSRLIELESGSILIDGQDISKVSLRHLRSKVTVIPQDPTLFTGSLRFNIDPLGEHTEE